MPSFISTGHTTHPALHLRDAADAHIVFEAVRLQLLPLIKRRLTSEERDQLTSGNVFVWEEAEHKGGLERWTDGRRWSQSRMKGEYLFYEEKVETTEEEKQAKAARRANRNSGPPHQVHPPTRRQDRPAKPDGLTKQTYSTHVYLPGSASPRKWHIVAYFSGNDYARLPVVENYDYLRNLRIPDGVFFSSKSLLRKSDRTFSGDEDDEYQSGGSSMHDGLSYGPSSPVMQKIGESDIHSQRPRSHTAFAASNTVDDYYSRKGSFETNSRHQFHHSTGPRPGANRSVTYDSGSLPRLSTIAPTPQYVLVSPASPTLSPGNGIFHGPHLPGPQGYMPLSSEDRRALNTFKVIL